MMAHSIAHALGSTYINRVIVSTDSEEYAAIAREYGAEAPFLRPLEYATDTALDIDVFYHALSYLKETEGYIPDIVVHLRPTYPIRKIEDIDAMIEIIQKDQTIDSVRSIAPAKEIPYKMWKMGEDGKLTPVVTDISECYNMPRQQLPTAYYQNACIDIVRSKIILEQKSMTGQNIYGYVMDKNYDIDTEEEFLKAEEYMKITNGKKRFVFDIDGVIAKIQKENDYSKSEPNLPMIQVVNQLYQMGNEIILFTARGYVTGINWEETTKNQLKEWGVSYKELHFGKPNADYYVDDKMLDMNDLLDMFI